MKKLIICLLAGVCCLGAKAQTVDVYHGINAGVGTSEIFTTHVGYYLDLHMRKRLYLFTKYNIYYYDYRIGNPNENIRRINFVPSVCFAFRLNGEDKKWNYFPYAGIDAGLADYYIGNWIFNDYPPRRFQFGAKASFLVGFEVKYKLKDKYNLGLGVEYSDYYTFGGFRTFIKFGWNRQYKNK